MQFNTNLNPFDSNNHSLQVARSMTAKQTRLLPHNSPERHAMQLAGVTKNFQLQNEPKGMGPVTLAVS
jgi:hypothetical protein